MAHPGAGGKDLLHFRLYVDIHGGINFQTAIVDHLKRLTLRVAKLLI